MSARGAGTPPVFLSGELRGSIDPHRFGCCYGAAAARSAMVANLV
jgi:hypothetical protein